MLWGHCALLTLAQGPVRASKRASPGCFCRMSGLPAARSGATEVARTDPAGAPLRSAVVHLGRIAPESCSVIRAT